MIESTVIRRNGAYDFITHYENLCALQSSCPVAVIKACVKENQLIINGNQIRSNDWMPILNTLRINKTLHSIVIISDTDKVRRSVPAIRKADLVLRFCKSLKECLVISQHLKVIEIKGLPLQGKSVAALAKGIKCSATLQYLSLEGIHLSPECVEVLCRGVRQSLTLKYLTLHSCNLGVRCAESISKLIKYQATQSHNEAWQTSLRYRRPPLDSMPGVRRITLNSNPELGDVGFQHLSEALKDDLWLKALDLQECSIGDAGAALALDVLNYNNNIVIIDLRQNNIESHLLKKIEEGLNKEKNYCDTQYDWMPIEKKDIFKTPTKSRTPKKIFRKLQYNIIGKSTTIKSFSPRRGIPWRTAQRAAKQSGQQIAGCGDDGGRGGNLAAPECIEYVTPRHGSHRPPTPSPADKAKPDTNPEHSRVLRKLELQLKMVGQYVMERDNKMILIKEIERLNNESLNREELGNHFSKLSKFIDILNEAGLSELVDYSGITNVLSSNLAKSLNIS